MKLISKRLLGLLLAVAVLASVLPMGVFAEEGEYSSVTWEQEAVYTGGDEQSGYALRETREELGAGVAGASAAKTFGAPANAAADGSMYSQLTQRQKACYDALEGIAIDRILTAAESDGYKYIKVRIDDFYGLVLKGTVKGSVFDADSSSTAVESSIYTDLCAAIVALRYDRADILWVSDMRYGYNWINQNNGTVKVSDALFAFKLLYSGQEKKMWEAMTGEAERIASQIDTKADTYTQVKALHDLLAQRNTYNDKPANDMDENLSHTAYSGLISGDAYEPVCDGYSKALKVVSRLLNIPCALASSETHMWNNVKMDDGEWYNIDLTWDDDNDLEISYDYFLIGSQTEINGNVFSKQADHIEENPYTQEEGLNALTLRFPTKSKTAYEYLGENYPSLRFPDVKRSSWYYNVVEKAAELGLFQGDKDGNFLPTKNITRAEFAKVMANSMNVDLSKYSSAGFTDVPDGKWYTASAAWAREVGLMEGYKDGSFRPNNPITREEMCKVLYNTMNMDGDKTETPDGTFTFADHARISNWAKVSVYTCYNLGLIEGDKTGKFSPRNNTLRSEAAAVFSRYAELGQA